MIPVSVSLSHYKRKDVQEEMVAHAENREVAIRFNENFGKRPDILRNPNDVLELAKQGATSFHASEELWKNPLQLDPSLRRHELDSLRTGWDLVIDIDCSVFEYSKIAAELVVSALRFHKVSSVSIKFSGNKGFHIGVPFEAFPDKVRSHEIRSMFPEAPKKIALYIKHMIVPEFSSRIMKLEGNDLGKVLEKTAKERKEVISKKDGKEAFNTEPILQMDTLLISPRHLYRMPYSMHEKSGLVSIPFNPDKVMLFRKELAMPKNVRISIHRFLDRANVKKDDAMQLFREAFDFHAKEEFAEESHGSGRKFEYVQGAIPEELFPPCIKLILEGIGDGRKRALFILINYLTSIGWDYEAVEKKLKEWNAKNREQLRENYLLGQLRYHKQMKKKVLPPNCSNEMYMKGIGVCRPDSFCQRIKNPAQYSTKKVWMLNSSKPKRSRRAEGGSNARQTD